MFKVLAVAALLATATLTGAARPAAAQVATLDAAPIWQLDVPVLYYHHVACPSATTTEPEYFICPDQFRAQLQYLKDSGWTAITGDDLAGYFSSRTCPPAHSFVVSIDDGDLDAYTTAAPLLEQLGMRGTFFVIAGRDGTKGTMTNVDVQDLAARGHAIGNHTMTHPNLRKLDAAALSQEIEGAQQTLAALLGYRPRTFAYPYGRYDDAAVAAVAQSGFDLAFTVHAGALESSASPLLSKRIEVGALESGASVLNKILPYSGGCAPPTPDLAIAKNQAGPYSGFKLLSSTPLASETIRRNRVAAPTTYRYYVELKNASNNARSYVVTLDRTGAANAGVVVKANGTDITHTLAIGSFATPVLDPWTVLPMQIQITTKKGTSSGALRVLLRAAANVDVIDEVQAVVK